MKMKKLLIFLIALITLVASAQDKKAIVTLKSGTELKGVIKAINSTEALTIVIAGVETTIKMADIARVEELVESNDCLNEQKIVSNLNDTGKVVITEDPLKNFKGFLLEKGNNVYVYCRHSDIDHNDIPESRISSIVKKTLTDLLKKDGFWNVVDDINKAHFVINYILTTEGSDKTILSISSWRTKKSYGLSQEGGNENIAENMLRAEKMYKKKIVPFQNKIIRGKVSKMIFDDFSIK